MWTLTCLCGNGHIEHKLLCYAAEQCEQGNHWKPHHAHAWSCEPTHDTQWWTSWRAWLPVVIDRMHDQHVHCTKACCIGWMQCSRHQCHVTCLLEPRPAETAHAAAPAARTNPVLHVTWLVISCQGQSWLERTTAFQCLVWHMTPALCCWVALATKTGLWPRNIMLVTQAIATC